MDIIENISLAPLTTFQIGGKARYYAHVGDARELPALFQFAKDKNIPVFILGGGSNLLLSDEGYPGLVLHVRIKDVDITEGESDMRIVVGAGHSWDDLVALAVACDAGGIENLSLIPGTVGGAVVQNIGAYGCEMREVVEWVEVYDPKAKRVRKLTHAECAFGYRDSAWKHKERGTIVTRVGLKLKKNSLPNISYKDLAAHMRKEGITNPTVRDVRTAVIAIRSAKFPPLSTHGTAGSFFKNPVVAREIAEAFLLRFPDAPQYDAGGGLAKLSAAWIIDHALCMRGVRVGNVGCWDAQALVVVNYGGATSADVKKFVREIQDRAQKEVAIMLEPEVIIVDE